MMISYAQNQEDVLIRRCFRDQQTGFYVDVGAWDPVLDSVTKYFYELGWSGINIEPHPTSFEKIQRDRPRDINLNQAMSNVRGEMTLHVFDNYLGLCSLSDLDVDVETLPDPSKAEKSVLPVCVDTLDHVLEAHGVTHIDFLKIDVEGAERLVLDGLDLTRHRPILLIIEATKPNLPTPSHQDWEPGVLTAGYEWCFFDGVNRYYLRQESCALRSH